MLIIHKRMVSWDANLHHRNHRHSVFVLRVKEPQFVMLFINAVECAKMMGMDNILVKPPLEVKPVPNIWYEERERQ